MKLRWNRKGPKGTIAYVVGDDGIPVHVSAADLDFIGDQRKRYRNATAQARVEKKRSYRLGVSQKPPSYIPPDTTVVVGQHWKRLNNVGAVVRIDAVNGQLVLATYIAASPQFLGKQFKTALSAFRPVINGWALDTQGST